jgi:hypothetical protein
MVGYTFRAASSRQPLRLSWSLGNALAMAAGALSIGLYYFIILTDGHTSPFQPVNIGLTFNSMLEHLLHGQVDIAPEVVRFEGYVRDGRVYSYWGIFCALIRLPLLAFPNGLATDVTVLSCVLAATTGTILNLLTLRLLARRLPKLFVTGVAFYLVFSGQNFGFLKATVYQEILLWSGTLASAFLLIAINGFERGRLTTRMLLGLALFAGLGLLARVTFGIGMYLALGLLLLKPVIESRGRALRSFSVIGPALVLIGFAAATGTVNYYRWGSPLVFLDNSGYALNGIYPDRRVREAAYGMFNIHRIPYSLDYYFGLLWTMRTESGFLFQDSHQRLYDVIELPQSSFLLTDLFVFVIFACGVVLARREVSRSDMAFIGALLGGFTVQALLILCAISTAYRYRGDFYPLIDAMLFIGLLLLARAPGRRGGVIKVSLVAAVAVSVVSGHISLGLYKLSPLGMYTLSVPGSLSDYYVEQFDHRFGSLIQPRPMEPHS